MTWRFGPWCTAALLFLPSIGGAQVPDMEDGAGAPCPPAKPKVSLARRSVPPERAYVALVNTVQRKAALDMHADGAIRLDRTVGTAPRKAAGADLGAILLSNNDVSAAVYATAISAKRDPADAVTANNLGAALKVARAYDSAFAVLAYTNALQPGSPIILTNLGNVAFALGDGNAAGGYYRAALAVNPEHPAALTGLGSLALCQGDREAAKRFFRKALSQMYLPAARAGVKDAQSVDDAPDEPERSRTQGPGANGAAETPITHPTGKGGGDGLFLAQPPVSGSARETANGAERIQGLVADSEQRMSEVNERLGSLNESMAANVQGAAGGSSRGLTARNTFEKEAFVLDDMLSIFSERIARVQQRMPEGMELMAKADARDNAIVENGWNAELACGDDEPCVQGVRLRTCRLRHAHAEKTHQAFLPIWQDVWQTTYATLTDYYAFSSPWLQDMHDTTLNQLYNLTRQAYIIAQATAAYSLAQGEAESLARMLEDDCGRFMVPPRVPDTRPLKMWPDDPTRCRSGTLYLTLLFATVEGNCDALKLEFAAGIFVQGQYRWGNTSADDQITLYGGVGVSLGAGKVSASGKIGPYVTYKLSGDGPKMVDYGVKDEAGLKVDLGPVRGEAKAEARLGAETGVTVDYSTKAKVGAKIQ